MQTRFLFLGHFLKPSQCVMFFLLIGLCSFANAATYNLSSGSYPPCIFTGGGASNWSVSGTTYTCNGDARVILAAGDVIVSSSTATIYANSGFSLASNTTVGSSGVRINLTSNYGSIMSTGTTSVFGNVNAGSGLVTLANATINGTLTSTADITLTGGSVTGLVTSSSNRITTNGTNLGGGATANNGMTITGGTIAGNFVATNGSVALSGVTMTSGSITGPNSVTIENGSVLGSGSSSITINTNFGPINVNNSTVYGNLTAPNYSTVNVTNGGSVYGTCSPNSTPANACGGVPLTPTPMNCSAGVASGITGSYFNNRTLTEPSTGSRSDAPIDFNWGAANPGVSGINVDNFSTRWSGYIRATQTGTYRFQTVSDDGVRLYINGTLVIDRWNDHSSTTDTTGDYNLVAGNTYSIRLEYYENAGDAVIRLQWRLPGATSFVAIPGGPTPTLGAGLYECVKQPISSCASNSKLIAGISGNYFNNQTLTAPATSVRLDGPINFDWGAGTPGPTGIGADNFSASWNGYVYVTQTGVHRFQTTSDDGVRLTVNGDLLIDQWNDHSSTIHTTAAVTLEAGKAYPIKLEFYENTGTALIQLRWQTPGSAAYAAIPIGVNASPVSAPGLYQCNTIAGYAISHSGTGVTCAGETITFTAVDFDGIPIKPVNGTNLILGTSSTSSQWVNGNSAGFDGTTTSVTKTLRQPVPATVNIDVRDNNGLVELATKDPSIIFSDAALKFSNIPTQVAGVVDNNITLSAVKTDQITGACVPQLSGNKTARIAFSCINPTSCVSTEQLTLNNLAAKANNAGATITYNTVTLNFNASGIASLPLRYTDVGQVQLHAQVDLPGSVNDPAVTVSGSSNSFVVKPYALKVTNAAQSASPFKVNPGSTNSGAGFIPAGEKFNVTVKSYNALGAVTPNFGNETTTSERNKIQLQMGCPERGDENAAACATRRPDYPSGASAGNLAIEPFSSSVTGGAVFPAVWNEVGSFKLEANLSGTGYLGVGAPAKITPSEIVGRFYPDRFNLTSSSVANSCGSFSYMGQPLTLNYLIQALGTAGNVLNNYGPAYGAMPTITYVSENADAGVNLARFSDGITKTWSSGALTVNSSVATFGRSTPNGMYDGPYGTLQIGLQLVDTFDSRNLQNLDMNASATGVCTGSNCTAKRLGSALSMRFGRLRLDDAFGPETATLPVNFVTEYWTGANFVKNSNDGCTKILRSAITYPAGSILTPANLQVPLTGGTTTGNYASITPTEIEFSSGDAKHYFSAPTGGAQGAFTVRVDLTSYPWLRFDWNQDGNYADTSLPNARFGFGSYRGHDRVIYWREVFN